MKALIFFILLSYSYIGSAQSLPINFEGDIETTNFIDFDGGEAAVIDNPQMTGINASDKVAQIVRDGGALWSGSKIALASNLDFAMQNSIAMKVYTTAPVGTTVKFKLEGDGATERDVQTTVSGEWEELVWDFTGTPMNFNEVVFMFDFGNVGDGSATSTFLFDDIEQRFSGFQIDWPVDFESADINYNMTDFGGNNSELVEDPTDPTNHVIKVIKTNGAATWAGTTIGTAGGFATDIPLALSDSKMTVRVWSPTAGTPIRLKVENSDDPTQTCETQTNTTVAEAWETIEFDFLNEATGTVLLSDGLQRGWKFNMASIFFDFGTEGNADEQTYYFDDVLFGDLVLSTEEIAVASVKVFPNPAIERWMISSENSIKQIELYDLQGRLLDTFKSDGPSVSIDASNLGSGVYNARVVTTDGYGIVQLIRR